jgi:hypothetical protein
VSEWGFEGLCDLVSNQQENVCARIVNLMLVISCVKDDKRLPQVGIT